MQGYNLPRGEGGGPPMSAIETYLARPWLAHYQKGVPASVDVPLKSVPQLFDDATERAPERPAVVFYGRSISYRELRDATDRFAAALAALGVRKASASRSTCSTARNSSSLISRRSSAAR